MQAQRPRQISLSVTRLQPFAALADGENRLTDTGKKRYNIFVASPSRPPHTAPESPRHPFICTEHSLKGIIMRCPKCGYISFDAAAPCSGCSTDLSATANLLHGTAIAGSPRVFLHPPDEQESAAPAPNEGHEENIDDAIAMTEMAEIEDLTFDLEDDPGLAMPDEHIIARQDDTVAEETDLLLVEPEDISLALNEPDEPPDLLVAASAGTAAVAGVLGDVFHEEDHSLSLDDISTADSETDLDLADNDSTLDFTLNDIESTAQEPHDNGISLTIDPSPRPGGAMTLTGEDDGIAMSDETLDLGAMHDLSLDEEPLSLDTMNSNQVESLDFEDLGQNDTTHQQSGLSLESESDEAIDDLTNLFDDIVINDTQSDDDAKPMRTDIVDLELELNKE